MDQDETWYGDKGKERKCIYIAPFRTKVHTKRSGMDHTVLPANNTMPAFLRGVHQMSPPQQLRQQTSNCSSLPRPHSVRWGPTPRKGHSPQFLANVCCGQTAGSIKMPLGTEVDLGPGDIVLDGFPTPLQQWDTAWLNFRPMSVVAKQLDRSRCHLVRR